MKWYLTVLIFLTVSFAQAESAAPFPENVDNWQSMQTPLTKIGALPGCDADVSSLPQIYQETVATYCAVRPNGPGKVDVLVRPEVVEAYKKRDGGFPEGSNMILHLKDMNIYFVSGVAAGEPVYGVYTTDGKDISADQEGHPLNTQTCQVCHSGYASYCVKGQCGISK